MTQTGPELTKSIKILIVEDDEDVRGLLVETVNRLGYPAVATDKAEEALSSIERGDADLISARSEDAGGRGPRVAKSYSSSALFDPGYCGFRLYLPGCCKGPCSHWRPGHGSQTLQTRPTRRRAGSRGNEVLWKLTKQPRSNRARPGIDARPSLCGDAPSFWSLPASPVPNIRRTRMPPRIQAYRPATGSSASPRLISDSTLTTP